MPRQRQPNASLTADAEDLKSSGGGNPRVGSIPTAGIELATSLGAELAERFGNTVDVALD